MTGHSLGTAVASLAYARAVSAKNDFGRKCVVRDAYLFATPIMTDVTSVHAFNYAMFKNVEKTRTMWRITNVGYTFHRHMDGVLTSGYHRSSSAFVYRETTSSLPAFLKVATVPTV